jgi:hypothetical protein
MNCERHPAGVISNCISQALQKYLQRQSNFGRFDDLEEPLRRVYILPGDRSCMTISPMLTHLLIYIQIQKLTILFRDTWLTLLISPLVRVLLKRW